MLADEKEAKLKKNNDFQVNTGGFPEKQIVDLKHLPDTRFCITAPKDSTSITLWEMGTTDTDLIQKHNTVTSVVSNNLCTYIDVCNDQTNKYIVFGSTLDNVTILDANNMKPIGDTSKSKDGDNISSLYLKSSNDVYICTNVGDIYHIDTRTSFHPVICHQHQICNKNTHWTMDHLNNQSNCLLQVSSDFDACYYDIRSSKTYLKQLDLYDDHVSRTNNSSLHVKSSADGTKFSINGLDGMVYIYNTLSLTLEDKILEPVFIHKGHVMNSETQTGSLYITSHLWHPWQQDLIISAASDCSLHAWQYNL
ncbi:WD repeat-containing protein [Mactra antiquata]